MASEDLPGTFERFFRRLGEALPGSDLDVLIVSDGVSEDLEDRVDLIREFER
ncbi:nucleotidyltransferase domain-containing protein [Methanopyrus kandleri]